MGSAYDIVMSSRKEIVDQLLKRMEQGYAETGAAWSSIGIGRPYNPVSETAYKGGNRFRLMLAAEDNGFKDPRWMTFQQANENHYKIASGSKGVLIEKYIFQKDVQKLDAEGKPLFLEDGKPEMEHIILRHPIVSYFKVFNGEQIIGLPELEQREVAEDSFSKMADAFEKSSKCPILYEMQDRAYYSPLEDKIHLPPKSAFKSNETRLSILLHEMAHSTGHETRLDRPIKNSHESVEYAREELNAELSSIFIQNDLGISLEPDSELLKDHANYVKFYLSKDPNALFDACTAAEEITEYLIKNYEMEAEQINQMEQLKRLTPDEQWSLVKEAREMLAERYMEAMSILGYQRLMDHPTAQEGFLVFSNAVGEIRIIDGWQLVGDALEEQDITGMGQEQRTAFEKLIHPEGRLVYYTEMPDPENPRRAPGTMQIHESFDEAFDTYRQAGLIDGKAMGVVIAGRRAIDLASYNFRNMVHDLSTAASDPKRYATEATVNERDELSVHGEQLVSTLQRENILVQILEAKADVISQVDFDIQDGNERKEWRVRVANSHRPQDYVEYHVQRMPDDQKVEMQTRIVHGNEVTQEKALQIDVDQIMKNGVNAFEQKDIGQWLKDQVDHMDIDLHTCMGQSTFEKYSEDFFNSVDKHYEMLEAAGYDRMPSYPVTSELHVGQNVAVFSPFSYENMTEVIKDIEKSGFKPNQELMTNILGLQYMEWKKFTMKDLAELKKNNPDFKGRRAECFDKIVKECQKQEVEMRKKNNMPQQKNSFLKQQMTAEMQASL